MSQNSLSPSAIAKASVQRLFLDARMARHHHSFASFALELELAQERYEMALATKQEVSEVEVSYRERPGTRALAPMRRQVSNLRPRIMSGMPRRN